MAEGPINPLKPDESEIPRGGLRRLIKEHVYKGPYKPILEQAPALFKNQEHVAVFDRFARQLDAIAKTQDMYSKSAQKDARAALGELWRMFTWDIHDFNRRSERVKAEGSLTADEVIRGKEEQSKRPEPAFRSFEESMNYTLAPIEEPFERSTEHIFYVGEKYNTVLPMLQKRMEGYVKQMIKGHRDLPVDGNLVRARISTLLGTTEEITRVVAAADLAFDKAQEETRKRRIRADVDAESRPKK